MTNQSDNSHQSQPKQQLSGILASLHGEELEITGIVFDEDDDPCWGFFNSPVGTDLICDWPKLILDDGPQYVIEIHSGADGHDNSRIRFEIIERLD